MVGTIFGTVPSVIGTIWGKKLCWFFSGQNRTIIEGTDFEKSALVLYYRHNFGKITVFWFFGGQMHTMIKGTQVEKVPSIISAI